MAKCKIDVEGFVLVFGLIEPVVIVENDNLH